MGCCGSKASSEPPVRSQSSGSSGFVQELDGPVNVGGGAIAAAPPPAAVDLHVATAAAAEAMAAMVAEVAEAREQAMVERAVRAQCAHLDAVDAEVLRLGGVASGREVLRAEFGVMRNAIGLALTLGDESGPARREAKAAAAARDAGLVAARAAALAEGAGAGMPPSAAAAFAELTEPAKPFGARVAWASVVEAMAASGSSGASALGEALEVLELPAAAALSVLALLADDADDGGEVTQRGFVPAALSLRPPAHRNLLVAALAQPTAMDFYGAPPRTPSGPTPAPVAASPPRTSRPTVYTGDASTVAVLAAAAAAEPRAAEVEGAGSRGSVRARSTTLAAEAAGVAAANAAAEADTAEAAAVPQRVVAPTADGASRARVALSVADSEAAHAAAEAADADAATVLRSVPTVSDRVVRKAGASASASASATEEALTARARDASASAAVAATAAADATAAKWLRVKDATPTLNGLLECVAAPGVLSCVCTGAYSSFGLTTQGDTLCWGRGEFGELGVDDAASLDEDEADGALHSAAPRLPVALAATRISLLAASSHVLGVSTVGELFVWGSANGGVLGIGPPSSLRLLPECEPGVWLQPTPLRVPALAGTAVRAVAAGEDHSLAATEAGGTLAWGRCMQGRLGLSRAIAPVGATGEAVRVIDGAVWVPAVVGGLAAAAVRAVFAGRQHSLALCDEGRLYSWGAARYGRLGLGDVAALPTEHAEPVQPEPVPLAALGGLRVIDAAAGAAHTIALCEEPARADDAEAAAACAAAALATGRPAIAPRAAASRCVYVWGLSACGRLGLPLRSSLSARSQRSSPDVLCRPGATARRATSVNRLLGSGSSGASPPAGGSDGAPVKPPMARNCSSVLFESGGSSAAPPSPTDSFDGQVALRTFDEGSLQLPELSRREFSAALDAIDNTPRTAGGTPSASSCKGSTCGDARSQESSRLDAHGSVASVPGCADSLRIDEDGSCDSATARGGARDGLAGHAPEATPVAALQWRTGRSPPHSPSGPVHASASVHVRRLSRARRGSAAAASSPPTSVRFPTDFPPFAFDDDDDEAYVAVPTRLAALDGARVVSVAAGAAHSFATTAGGAAYGWGLATSGRLGIGSEDTLAEDEDGDVFVPEPTLLHGCNGYEVVGIAAAETHSLALTATGQLLAWGAASYGRLSFAEGALTMPREPSDGGAYQPLPRQVWIDEPPPRPPGCDARAAGRLSVCPPREPEKLGISAAGAGGKLRG